MSILLNDNLSIQAPKATDSRYGPFADTATALTSVILANRYQGLTVGIGSGTIIEYWFRDGTADANLILKVDNTANTGSANTIFLQGALNTANANTIYTQGVDLTQNTWISSNSLYSQAAFAQANLTAGGLVTANANTIYLQGALNTANANTVFLTGVNTTQNSWISSNAAYTQSAFNTANVGNTFVNTGGTVNGSITIVGSLNVSGNINVAGSLVTYSANSVSVQDPIIYLAANNSANVVDIGMAGHFVGGAYNNYQHTGVVRNHLTGNWVFFSNVSSEPSATINFAEANLVYDSITAGGFNVNGRELYTYSSYLQGGINSANANTVFIQGGLNTANANTVYLSGALATANANTVFLTGVNLTQNAWISANQVYSQAAFAQANLTAGGLVTANANTILLQGGLNTANANTVYTQGVDLTQNTWISSNSLYSQAAFAQANSANSLAQSAYDKANTATNTTVYLTGALASENANSTLLFSYVNSANANIISIQSYANTLLPNTGSLITVNSASRLYVSNTTTSTSNTTGALVVGGGIGVAGPIYSTGGSITINNGIVGAGNTGTIFLGDGSFSKSFGGSWTFAGGVYSSSSGFSVPGTPNNNAVSGFNFNSAGAGMFVPFSGYIGFQTNNANTLFLTSPTSSVNYLQVSGNTTGNTPVISSQGTDTNISIQLLPKGNGSIILSSNVFLPANTAVSVGTTLPNAALHIVQQGGSGPGSIPTIILENPLPVTSSTQAAALYMRVNSTQAGIAYDWFGNYITSGTNITPAHGLNYIAGRSGQANHQFRNSANQTQVIITDSGQSGANYPQATIGTVISNSYFANQTWAQSGPYTNLQVTGNTTVNGVSTLQNVVVQGQNNLFTYSADFTQSVWQKSNTIINSSTGQVAPDNLSIVQSVTANQSSGNGSIYRTTTTTNQNGYWTFSFYAAANTVGTGPNPTILYATLGTANSNNYTTNTTFSFPLSGNNPVSPTFVSQNGVVANTASVFRVNGSYRCIITGLLYDPTGSGIIRTDISIPTNVNSNSSAYIWGTQLEQGQQASNYTPTSSAAVITNNNVYLPTGNVQSTNMVVSNKVNWVNSNNISVMYQTYNPATSSFDIVLG